MVLYSQFICAVYIDVLKVFIVILNSNTLKNRSHHSIFVKRICLSDLFMVLVKCRNFLNITECQEHYLSHLVIINFLIVSQISCCCCCFCCCNMCNNSNCHSISLFKKNFAVIFLKSHTMKIFDLKRNYVFSIVGDYKLVSWKRPLILRPPSQ